MTIGELISQLAFVNASLWHEEDKAASPCDHEVAAAKRCITALNVQRNTLIEAIDAKVLEMVTNGDTWVVG